MDQMCARRMRNVPFLPLLLRSFWSGKTWGGQRRAEKNSLLSLQFQPDPWWKSGNQGLVLPWRHFRPLRYQSLHIIKQDRHCPFFPPLLCLFWSGKTGIERTDTRSGENSLFHFSSIQTHDRSMEIKALASY